MPGGPASARLSSAKAGLYDIAPFGNVSLLHMTDCHAQLLPGHFREPSVNLGLAGMQGQWPHRVGGQLFTLVKQLKASRPGAQLLDGGDTWQGSATALWTNAQDMVDASKLLGVDLMTGHWEFTYGMDRVKQIVENDFKGHIEFLAQNIQTNDFGDLVFAPYALRSINGVPVAIPVANAGGKTLVTNAGSHGKFLGVTDFDVKGGKRADFRYRLLPIFANQLQADPAMAALITQVRAPYAARQATPYQHAQAAGGGGQPGPAGMSPGGAGCSTKPLHFSDASRP